MDFNAFEFITSSLGEELEKQGFGPAEPLESESGSAVMYRTDEVAYSVLYDEKHGRFDLRSTELHAKGQPGDWRRLSTWMFDSASGTRDDAASILNDFVDVVRGPKRVAMVQQKRKKGKDDERSVDPLFFMNRVANIFPDMKDELNEEKIVYGQVRAVTFTKASVLPRLEKAVADAPGGEQVKRFCALLDDMYKNGDMDLRSVVTCVVLNGLSDGAFEALRPQLGEELQKAVKYSRRLKDKKIKPEKKKKKSKKKVEARLES